MTPIRKAVVVLPVYNESETINQVLAHILAASNIVDILVVDDNSPDGSGDMVRHHKDFQNRVFLLSREKKLGLGSAYKEGFFWAMAREYDACVEMDADFSHDPNDIVRLFDALNAGADIAIGSRYIHGVRVLNWPLSRLFISVFASYYTRLLTRLPINDTTSGFKAIRMEVLRTLDWSKFTAQGYGFQIEIHFYAWKKGFHLEEVPIVFTERRDGSSKMSSAIAFEAAWRVISLAVGGN